MRGHGLDIFPAFVVHAVEVPQAVPELGGRGRAFQTPVQRAEVIEAGIQNHVVPFRVMAPGRRCRNTHGRSYVRSENFKKLTAGHRLAVHLKIRNVALLVSGVKFGYFDARAVVKPEHKRVADASHSRLVRGKTQHQPGG
jgi:hypothetical protein